MSAQRQSVCPSCGRPLSSAMSFCPACFLGDMLDDERTNSGEPSSEEAPDLLSERRAPRFGHFELLTTADGRPIELGRGAMGITYKAFDIDLQYPVTLKVISKKYLADESARLRFLREARAAASVRHPSVASVFHLGISGREYFYAMEFVEGETLESLIKRFGQLEIKLALEITLQVASGLAGIDKQKLVHRDIKPTNIMVSLEDGGAATAKIIDLGLAKPAGGAPGDTIISRTGGFAGTPAFASPEQFAGVGVDIRSDLYSLGIMLWEMLSGSLPFQGTGSELAYQHQHASLPVDRLTRVPQQIVPLLETLLEKDPAQRFQTPNDLLKALAIVTDAIDSGHRLTKGDLRSRVASAISPRRSPLLSPPQRQKRMSALAWLVLIPVVGALLVAQFFFFSHRGSPVNETHDAAPLSEKSVAVLPFENLSANKDDGYFADGVQDEILNNLAKIAQLKVISRTSVMQYRAETKRDLRQIATALGVVNVLEGTVQRSGNRVRVSTQLVDARKDQTIWADRYDRDLTDIFTIQSDVAQAIAAKLTATLSPAEKKSVEARPTDNLEAYDLYLRGKEALFNASGWIGDVYRTEQLLQAADFLERAVRLDPNFVLAYCGSASANDQLYRLTDTTPERLAQANAAMDVALRLRPDLPEVHLAQAEHLFYRDDPDGARVQLAIAKSGLPNSVEATTLEAIIDRTQGDWQKAIQGFKESLARNPRNFTTLNQLAETLTMTRKFDLAAALYDRMIDVRPDLSILKVLKAIDTRYLKDADTGAFWSAIAALPQSAATDPDVLGARLWFSLIDHDWTQAEQIIGNMKRRDIDPGTFVTPLLPVEYYAVLMARLRKDQPFTSASFAGIREQLNLRVSQSQQDAVLLSKLAVLDALLNNKEAAILEAKRASGILPVSKGAWSGPGVLKNSAVVYAWSGELDQAFAVLEPLTELPAGIFYGELKRDPWWEPLRQDPRYNKLLDKLAPKD